MRTPRSFRPSTFGW